jgi:RNA polymerase sigma-70 factor (ECF subfamily)
VIDEQTAPDGGDTAGTLSAGRGSQSFDEFFRDSYRALVKQAMYAGADRADAEDAASQTMLDVHLNWARIEDPLAWARCAVVRFFFKAKKRQLYRIRTVIIPLARADASLTNWEEWQWIKELLLDLLTPGQQEVMELVLEGYTPTEIAGRIRVTPEAVRQRIYLARELLREALQQQQDSELSDRPRARS